MLYIRLYVKLEDFMHRVMFLKTQFIKTMFCKIFNKMEVSSKVTLRREKGYQKRKSIVLNNFSYVIQYFVT